MATSIPEREHGPADERQVRVLQRDPDLGRGVSPDQLPLAERQLVAPVQNLKPGEWSGPWDSETDTTGDLGMLLLDGLVLRAQRIGTVSAAELLGAGDILRPWVTGQEGSSLPSNARWQVLQPTSLAVLDRRFALLAARWPEIGAALMERSVQRARLLSFQMAIASVRRIDARLLLLFWRLADRWGRVTADGVLVPLRLTHGWLASLVGAQRPSVTTALGHLAGAGRIDRLPDGSWLLRGDPPDLGEPLFAAVR